MKCFVVVGGWDRREVVVVVGRVGFVVGGRVGSASHRMRRITAAKAQT